MSREPCSGFSGNMLLNDKGHTQQRHCWDEENRLIMVHSGEKRAANYLYDANGERVYKVVGESHTMNINGWQQTTFATPYDPTLYASPYVVATPKGYTKHYYAGAERIVSRIGGGGLRDLRRPIGDYKNKLDEMWERIGEGWQPRCFCYGEKELEELMKQLEGTDMGRWEELGMFTPCEENEYRVYFRTEMKLLFEFQEVQHEEKYIYWYHPDHLGSSSWITDQDGEAIQHLQYLPFGEQYVDQRRTGWDAMFTFSGKERDQETGYGYFGARYYDSDISIWLSVDPLADKLPHQSPYVYCNNNPIILVDPDGRFPKGMHADMVKTAFQNSKLSSGAQTLLTRGASNRADIVKMDVSSVHMDNMKGTASISSAYKSAMTNFKSEMKQGNYLDAGVELHTVADFYSHSNYIPLYQQYATDNNLSLDIDAIPTFSEAMEMPELMQFIEDNGGLQTGEFSLSNPFSSDKGSHNKMNLDSSKSDTGKQAYNKQGATMHDAARAAAQKETNNMAKEY